MKYTTYVWHSLQIFIVCSLLGLYINHQFRLYQQRLTNPNYLLIGFAQLITIVTVTYFLQTLRFFHSFFEEYSPNVLFSTFLFALQTNMIQNFERVLLNGI